MKNIRQFIPIISLDLQYFRYPIYMCIDSRIEALYFVYDQLHTIIFHGNNLNIVYRL
jgi:hypothetical protein